jgi:hypothetical protein
MTRVDRLRPAATRGVRRMGLGIADPYVPAPRHGGSAAGLDLADPPGTNERRVTDKPLQAWFRESPGGYRPAMELSLLLIVIGIILAVLVDYGIGLACILVGLVLLIWPRLRASV